MPQYTFKKKKKKTIGKYFYNFFSLNIIIFSEESKIFLKVFITYLQIFPGLMYWFSSLHLQVLDYVASVLLITKEEFAELSFQNVLCLFSCGEGSK